MQPQEEQEIMRRAARDPAAFAPLYEQYVDRVYAYCLRRVDHVQEAEDLCSQVFTRALTSAHTYRGGNVAAWLFRIAHNLVIDHYRQRQSDISLERVDIPADADVDDYDPVLRRLVAELPDDEREVLALTLDGGLTSEQVGSLLGKSAGAVRVQAHRIIKRLRAAYRKATGEPRT
jgi:RNA polymerase sigma-70 factor (ECF subfamily)